MSRKKKSEVLENPTAEQIVEAAEAVATDPIEEQEQKEAAPSVDVEAIKAQARKEALAEIQKDLGITQAELNQAKLRKEADQKNKEADGQMMQIDIGSIEVRINGTRYSGKMTLPARVGEDVMAMAGKFRRRRVKEMFRHEYEVQQIAGGGFSSKLVKREQVIE